MAAFGDRCGALDSTIAMILLEALPSRGAEDFVDLVGSRWGGCYIMPYIL